MYCILVAGVPASGKTTMARCLSQTLNAPLFSKDAIKETLYDTVGFASRAQKVKLGEAAFAMMIQAADECLAHGLPVILENNFETATNPALRDMLARRGCPALTVMMTGDWETVHARFVLRNASPERHRGHVVNDCYPEGPGPSAPVPAMALEEFVRAFHGRGMDRPPVAGPCIVVDATDVARISGRRMRRRCARTWTRWGLRRPMTARWATRGTSLPTSSGKWSFSRWRRNAARRWTAENG